MLENIFQNLHDHGFAQIKNVLSSSELTLINEFISREKNLFSPAKVGYGAQRIRNEAIRGDYTLWLDPKAPLDFLQRPTLLLRDLQVELNQRFYFGLKEFEYHFAYYSEGYFYQKHVDAFEKDSSRVISFVFYLNETWLPEHGGELVIYAENGNDILHTVIPEAGSLVVFLSRNFPHEVKPSLKERRSLTGWIHNKILT